MRAGSATHTNEPSTLRPWPPHAGRRPFKGSQQKAGPPAAARRHAAPARGFWACRTLPPSLQLPPSLASMQCACSLSRGLSPTAHPNSVRLVPCKRFPLHPLTAPLQHAAALPAGWAGPWSGARLPGSYLHGGGTAGVARHLQRRPGRGWVGWPGLQGQREQMSAWCWDGVRRWPELCFACAGCAACIFAACALAALCVACAPPGTAGGPSMSAAEGRR